MNICTIVGRLTSKPELKATPNKVMVCSFTLAVERKFKDANGKTITDYIDCVAWKNKAEFICKWFDKGVRIAISGELQTRSWEDKNGNKRKAVEVICNEVEFADGKREANTETTNNEVSNDTFNDTDSFMPIEDDSELPF